MLYTALVGGYDSGRESVIVAEYEDIIVEDLPYCLLALLDDAV